MDNLLRPREIQPRFLIVRELDPDAGSGSSVLTMPATENSENAQTWKVGALAQLTGVTVPPCTTTTTWVCSPPLGAPKPGTGSTSDDVARLYRISSLRRLGFSLEHIAQVLDDPQWQLAQLVQRHLADISRRVELALALQSRLDAMSTVLARNDNPSTDELFATIEKMTMLDATVHSTTALLV